MIARWMADWRALPARQRMAIGLLALLLALVQIDQPFPETAVLHHVPTVIVLVAMPWLLRRWPLTTDELACALLFLALHSFGARWTYSNVPYDAWMKALAGVSLGDLAGWHRNHYDRLVHLMFGVLAVPPFAGIARRSYRASPRVATALAIGFVLAVGGFYEIVEWLLTMMVAPALADGYNGQQGDVWDAQKDMALAFVGALATAAITALRPSRKS